jgi:hypothetical protein
MTPPEICSMYNSMACRKLAWLFPIETRVYEGGQRERRGRGIAQYEHSDERGYG